MELAMNNLSIVIQFIVMARFISYLCKAKNDISFLWQNKRTILFME